VVNVWLVNAKSGAVALQNATFAPFAHVQFHGPVPVTDPESVPLAQVAAPAVGIESTMVPFAVPQAAPSPPFPLVPTLPPNCATTTLVPKSLREPLEVPRSAATFWFDWMSLAA
jgi:hypothetical protein